MKGLLQTLRSSNILKWKSGRNKIRSDVKDDLDGYKNYVMLQFQQADIR